MSINKIEIALLKGDNRTVFSVIHDAHGCHISGGHIDSAPFHSALERAQKDQAHVSIRLFQGNTTTNVHSYTINHAEIPSNIHSDEFRDFVGSVYNHIKEVAIKYREPLFVQTSRPRIAG